jgi:hypothetical protein
MVPRRKGCRVKYDYMDPSDSLSVRRLSSRVADDSKVLSVGKNLLANGRGRWLAVAASLVVTGAMVYSQATEARCCTVNSAAVPTRQEPPPAGAPYIASHSEAESLAASAPAVNPGTFPLPVGVAPEAGLQVHTIRVARAIAVMFPEITTIYGYRQDPLKWHPNGLAIDVMIPNHDTEEGIDLGNQIAGYALANAKRWGVVHVIWRHAIYPGPDSGQWMPDEGTETANHYDHVHIATDGGGYPTGNESYFL